jgi:phosphoglycolate phosphatase
MFVGLDEASFMQARSISGRLCRDTLMTRAPAGLRGLLLDKDGTLFDFQASWGRWTAGFVRRVTDGDAAKALALADSLGIDLATERFRKSSPMIAGTMEVAVAAVRAVMPETDEAALRAQIAVSSAAADQVPVTPLAPLFDRLAAGGLALGVATNDAEAPTRAHLARAGVLERVAFVAGYDSGFGAKPGPGMCAAFCGALGFAPAEVAIVGDSTHDLHSGRAAGLYTIAVLTGPAEAEELAPHADVVLPDIAALPDWLALGGAAAGRAG